MRCTHQDFGLWVRRCFGAVDRFKGSHVSFGSLPHPYSYDGLRGCVERSWARPSAASGPCSHTYSGPAARARALGIVHPGTGHGRCFRRLRLRRRPGVDTGAVRAIGTGRNADATALVEAAIGALLGISILVAIGLWIFVPVLVDRILQVPLGLRDQAIGAMRVLAAAAPLVVLNAALWGVLAAYQKFRAANLATIPVNLFYYLGPVLVLLVWDSLIGVMLALVACRLANTLSYLWLVRPLLPGLGLHRPRLALVVPLLRLGGWMTFSGLLTQALLYADRFLIGAILTLSAVAFYATPLDLVMRVWILPVAVAQTLLPAFASAFVTAPGPTAALLRRGGLLVMLLVLPACLVLVGGAHEILSLWLGQGFAEGSGRVLQWLGCGIFFSCVAFAPNALIDAIGRPDATAKSHSCRRWFSSRWRCC
ncbi:oligosaccharide flippase family protein [Paeniroseomonas aquatica]|uniref:oligosaccharide flippase family protein n=1 Tax=Paeniroseomonas aquatica TaxID=373043 RepID=UPI00360DD15E